MRDRKVYILGGLRSHIGIRYGIFKSVRPEVLGGRVAAELCRRYSVVPDLCICGNAVGPGGNIGRLLLLESGFPERVPAFTLDLQCASGLAAIDMAAGRIAAGQCDVVLAGGAESASLQPKRIYADHDERAKLRNPEFTAAQFMPGEFGDDAMLLGAERAAKAAGITREEADEAALRSQMLAKDASENGIFRDVILPLFGSTRDEAIRPRMSRKLLERAPRVTDFQDGILTAANSCTMNDGAPLSFFLFLKLGRMNMKSRLPLKSQIRGSSAAIPRCRLLRRTRRYRKCLRPISSLTRISMLSSITKHLPSSARIS